MKVKRGQRSGIDTIKYRTCPKKPHGKVTKTQLNITNKSEEPYVVEGEMMPKHWTQYIRRLDEGNERIIGIEVKGSPNSIFIINVYMLTKETNSQSNFNKNSDILHDMVVRYNRLGTVIVCGDMNGTLIEERNNSHDNSLMDFVKEHNLSWHINVIGNKSTFVSHTGILLGRSQIDYILCSNSSILASTKIEQKHCLNQSAHTVVSANVIIQLEGTLNTNKLKTVPKPYVKINWEKMNSEKFQEILHSKLNSLRGRHSLTTDGKLDYISYSLNESAFKVAPCRTVKWRGPQFRASPVVKNLLKGCKETHITLKENGSPGPDSAYYGKRKEAKKQLRRQLRKENYLKTVAFYSSLMQNPDTKTFYRLIKMNQTNRSNPSTCFITNGKSILDPVLQRITLKKIL